MKPRPIYRWKSFWLGLCVLVFLGWAWVLSTGHTDAVFLGIRANHWSLSSSIGEVRLDCHELFSGETRWIHRAGFVSEKRGRDDRGPVRMAFSRREHELPAGMGHITTWTVAHWFLILLFLVPWVGFLAWRVRKQRKHTA